MYVTICFVFLLINFKLETYQHFQIAKKAMDSMIERKLETIGCLIREINWFKILYDAQKYHGVMNESTFSQSDALYDVHYLIDLSRLLARTDKRIIANYLGWRVIESFGFLIGGSAFVGAYYLSTQRYTEYNNIVLMFA